MSLSDATRSRIDSLIAGHNVVLFMKGDRQIPQCGFSATVVQILDALIPDYTTVDVLRDLGVNVRRLFCPEHGLRVEAAAGEPACGPQHGEAE